MPMDTAKKSENDISRKGANRWRNVRVDRYNDVLKFLLVVPFSVNRRTSRASEILCFLTSQRGLRGIPNRNNKKNTAGNAGIPTPAPFYEPNCMVPTM